MKTENVIQEKSYEFALRVIRLCNYLSKEQKEYILSKQLLRSGTSVGANVEEALAASSKKDFKNKMAIASKEARESNYWLRLLRDSKALYEEKVKLLIDDSEELIKILTAIVKTAGKE